MYDPLNLQVRPYYDYYYYHYHYFIDGEIKEPRKVESFTTDHTIHLVERQRPNQAVWLHHKHNYKPYLTLKYLPRYVFLLHMILYSSIFI